VQKFYNKLSKKGQVKSRAKFSRVKNIFLSGKKALKNNILIDFAFNEHVYVWNVFQTNYIFHLLFATIFFYFFKMCTIVVNAKQLKFEMIAFL
jgi:hypothetical protein